MLELVVIHNNKLLVIIHNTIMFVMVYSITYGFTARYYWRRTLNAITW